VVTFRCGKCAETVRANSAAGGRAVACPRCGHLNVCPTPTFPPQSVRSTTRPGRSGVTPRGLWIAFGIVTLVGTSWMAYTQLIDEPGASAAEALSPSDALQHDLLKQDLEKPSDPALAAMYAGINAKYFSGTLPALAVMWEPGLARETALSNQQFSLQGMFGHIGKRSAILLNPSLQDDDAALQRALCHEIVHAYLFSTGANSSDHGPNFQAVLKHLSDAGAFQGIMATDADRSNLRAWLDAESKRLDEERQLMDSLEPDLNREKAEVEQALADYNTRVAAAKAAGATVPDDQSDVNSRLDAYNRRANDANARLAQDRADLEHFNQEVARYNLMLVYPDGLDESAAVKPKPTPTPRG
jgi:phage FluMu protein Com